jgi:hypothetical protein
MTITQSIEIVQSFRNWTNDASLPMTYTKEQVIEALDNVLIAAKELGKRIDNYKPLLDSIIEQESNT